MRRPDDKPRSQILESEIEDYLTNLCEAHDWLCLKCANIGTLGFPDRCVIADGRVVFVELKRPDHKPRKAQVRMMKNLRSHGAEVCVAHDADTVEAVVSLIERKKPIKTIDEVTFYVVSDLD